MRHRPRRRAIAPILALAVLAAVSVAPPIGAQQSVAPPQTAPAQTGPTAGEKFMNIHVLKDLPAAQLPDAMAFMAASLGTTCEMCHVRNADGEWAFDKDDKRAKVTARQMLQMTNGINAQSFKGQPTVNCMTCHQGHGGPISMPTLAQPQPASDQAAADRPQGGRPQPPAETADQVLDKYLQALGGPEALKKITSRLRRGTVTDRAGRTFPILIEEKAPDSYRATVDAKPPMTRAFDGAAAWLQAGDRIRDLAGVYLLDLTLAADLALPLQIKERYQGLASRQYDKIDGRDVIVLTGRPSADVMESLYFDRTSGLLVRRVARLRTPLGRLPVQIDYADYRPVGDVRMPFEVRVNDWDSLSIERFTDIKVNVAVDAARFAKPATPSGN